MSPNNALRFTRLRNDKGLLTKTYALDADGALQKPRTAAKLHQGHAERIECADIAEFMALRATLQPHEALAYGVAERPSVSITTQEELRKRPTLRRTHIARDAEHLHYAKAPGVLMLDHDAEHSAESFDRDGLRAAMVAAVPELGVSAPMAWATSASSYIMNDGTDEVLHGLRGQRLYVPVADATDIARIGRVIYERLWASGYGRFIVSASGALLDRNIVDASAWAPERIDFAAGAQCSAPLVQRAPAFHFWEAADGGLDPWDSRAYLPDLTADEAERAATNRAKARAEVQDEAKAKRVAYIDARGEALAQERGIDLDAAVGLVREAVENDLLFADFLLYPEEGEPVTVGQVLDDPGRWHNARFADPLEPSYRSDRRIAWCNLRSGGRPYLFSWAHGLNKRYELVRQPAMLRVQPGENARLTDECLRVMREHGDVFDFGTEMARVVAGRVFICNRGWVQDYLSRRVRFVRFDSRAPKGTDPWKPTDCPDKVAQAVMDRVAERGLPVLRGVITAPTMRDDGSVLDKPGYDSATGLLFVSDGNTPSVPANPTTTDVLAALRELMAPVSLFPYADAASRSVALSALLTACVRRSLPRAPGFANDAPVAGTGKSLLAQTVLALGGHSGASNTPPPTDEEMGKVLFASLRAGAGAIFFDNYAQPVGGPAIDQFLTAEVYSGRVLGTSTTAADMPNGALVLFTGNNLQIKGDTCRRVLVCRLDARVEHPNRRAFDFDPEQYVRSRRQSLVVAALTLMRGYLVSGAPLKGRPLGSFEKWDALVRQTVCWLAEMQDEFELADPSTTTEGTDAVDESKNHLGDMLTAWRSAFGDEPRTAAEVLTFVDDEYADDETKRAAQASLAQSVARLRRSPREPVDAVRLGMWLHKHRERVTCGMRFESPIARKNSRAWCAASVE
jgi:hypothetical protein